MMPGHGGLPHRKENQMERFMPVDPRMPSFFPGLNPQFCNSYVLLPSLWIKIKERTSGNVKKNMVQRMQRLSVGLQSQENKKWAMEEGSCKSYNWLRCLIK
jgi:hypothetical protein